MASGTDESESGESLEAAVLRADPQDGLRCTRCGHTPHGAGFWFCLDEAAPPGDRHAWRHRCLDRGPFPSADELRRELWADERSGRAAVLRAVREACGRAGKSLAELAALEALLARTARELGQIVDERIEEREAAQAAEQRPDEAAP